MQRGICDGLNVLDLGAVCAALTARTQTGRGQYVEATMVQGLNALDYLTTMGTQLAARSGMSSEDTMSAAMKFVAASRYSMIFPTLDGRWVATTQMLPHQARALSRAKIGYSADEIRQLLDDEVAFAQS